MKSSRLPSRCLTFVAALCLSPSVLADYTVRCGSDGHRYRTCRLQEPGYVTLEKKISGAACVQGRSWDFNRREIWVDDGCEADFRVETHGGSGSSSASGSSSGPGPPVTSPVPAPRPQLLIAAS